MSGQLAVVEQAYNVLYKVQEYINTGFETTIEVASEVIEQERDGPNIQHRIGEMEDIMLRYVKNDQELKRFLDAADHAKQFVRNGGDIESMEEELDNKLAELEAEDTQQGKEHPKYMEMMTAIKYKGQASQEEDMEAEEEEETGRATEAGDEDVAITQGEIKSKCPYTGKEMTRPVRNKHCGHHYDKAGFQEMCKKRARPKCPIPGCRHQSPISMDDVEDDPKMKALIDAKNKKAAKKGKRK